MEILTVNTARMPNDMFYQFYREIIERVGGLDLTALRIAGQAAALAAAHGNVDAALKKITKSAFTATLQEADRARDETFLGMVETNRAALRHFTPEVKTAAARVKVVFDTYGNIAAKPMNEQTSAVINLLQEITGAGAYAAAAKTVGLDAWAEELRRRNAEFERVMNERFDETAAKTAISLKTARAELDAAFRALRKRIEAVIELESAEPFEAFIRAINAIIDKYAKLLAMKTGKRSGNRGTGNGGEDVGDDDNGDTDLGGSDDE